MTAPSLLDSNGARSRFTALTLIALLAIAGALSTSCGGEDKEDTDSSSSSGGERGNDDEDGGADAPGGSSNGNAGESGMSGGSGGASGAGVGGAGGAEPISPTDGRIGTRCEGAADCMDGLDCVSSADDIGTLGGPPAGWCTLPCTTNTECAAVSDVAVCVGFSDNGTPEDMTDDIAYCSELCLLGNPMAEADNKCHWRAEMSCYPVIPEDPAMPLTVGFCVPSCANDSYCGDRFCDPASGLCVDTPPAGDPVGSDCTVGTDSCMGSCVRASATDLTDGMCTATCTVGAPDSCGRDPAGAEPSPGICLPLGNLPELGGGDTGLCYQTCDCNDECSKVGGICLAFGSAEVETAFGHLGYCVPGGGAPAADAGVVAGDAGAPLGIPCQ